MLILPGYQIKEKLYEGADSMVYRAIRLSDNQTVVVKLLKEEYPSFERIARFQHEYDILKKLNREGTVAAYSLEKYKNSLLIILEDFGKYSLRDLLQNRRLEITEVLKIALLILDCLEKIHQHHIIHKDINPANILWNPDTQNIKIIDFSIATALPIENPEILSPNVLEGMLSYLSPEQTGRMNRTIDYRSDYYSFGVTLYEMLTGKLPFQSNDPLELVHAHIAKLPQSPHEFDANIPETLSNIVMKLISKMAEDRYQSHHALKLDLQTCLDKLEQTGTIKNFPIAEEDFSDRFQIPEKLYGRRKEKEILVDAFERVCGGPSELTLVAGYSGIGKSCLIHELLKPAIQKRAYFISGKFSQLQRNIPYAPIREAINEFVRQILSETDDNIKRWKNEIRNALGQNGQVLVDLVPSLEAVIGKQPEVPSLGPTESQYRFNFVFQNFIRVLASAEHPLVLFLDDMQWSDLPSLKLIENVFIQGSIQYFYIIGAYRDQEVSKAHPLMLSIELLQKSNIPLSSLILTPLQVSHVQQLLVDTLHHKSSEVERFALVCHKKTQGNPFYLNVFLRTLFEEGYIYFNRNEGVWSWDIEKIEKRESTDNVIDLLIEKLHKLPKITQEILEHAACLGTRFELSTLSNIYEQPSKNTANYLWNAIEEGLIVPLDEGYNLISDFVKIDANYRFLHDKVQQAAHALLSTEERTALHLKIGRLLLSSIPDNKREERIFDIVDQLNLAVVLITVPEEKIQLAELNLLAGKRAKSAAANSTAYQYFQTGLRLLDQSDWQKNYEIALQLHVEGIESAYLNNKLTEMDRLSKIALSNVHSVLDEVKIIKIKILERTANNKPLEAVELTLKMLNKLGFKLPKKPNKFHVVIELIKVKSLLRGKKPEELLNLPKMTDPIQIAIIQMILEAVHTVYISGTILIPLFGLRALQITLRYGYSRETARCYAVYATILSKLGDVENAYQFSRYALDLLERYHQVDIEGETLLITASFVDHWKEPYRFFIPVFQRAYLKNMETGNIDYAMLSIYKYLADSYKAGIELPKIASDNKKYFQIGKRFTELTMLPWFELMGQLIDNLTGLSQDPCHLTGNYYNEAKVQMLIDAKNNPGLFTFYYFKMILCYLFNDYEQAYENSIKVKMYAEPNKGLSADVFVNFYDSLVHLALFEKSSRFEKLKHYFAIFKNQMFLKRRMKHCPENIVNKFTLIKAELFNIRGKFELAEKNYENAIEFSKKYEFLHEQALANELAAKFYLRYGKEKIARVYMTEAYHAYLQWGGTAKIQLLKSTYPELLVRGGDSISHEISGKFTPTSKSISEVLDLSAVIKSSQAIAREIILRDLLDKLMHIIIQNAGGQKACLLLEDNGQWFIQAEVDDNKVTVLNSLPIENHLPSSVIQYVIHSKDSILIDDATQVNQFSSDPYMQVAHPKSLLCLPLLNHGMLSAILYLENNLAMGAFTQDRLALLNLLSAQIVISIDNARLYNQVSNLNKAYSRFVPTEFLSNLEKKSIIDVNLGDQVRREMTVMFCDIRDFTARSETLDPQQNFKFINEFLGYLGPHIAQYNGFIDKYIGDSIMALYPTSADDAVRSAIAILKASKEYNNAHPDALPTEIGIGLNTGQLMLGIVGSENRMEGTVISDAVNIASRTEDLTKSFGTPLLITENTYSALRNPSLYFIRKIDTAFLKGKTRPVTIYEVFDADFEPTRTLKKQTMESFEIGILCYQRKDYVKARNIFKHLLSINEADEAVREYLRLTTEAENMKKSSKKKKKTSG